VAEEAQKPEHEQDNNYSPEHGVPFDWIGRYCDTTSWFDQAKDRHLSRESKCQQCLFCDEVEPNFTSAPVSTDRAGFRLNRFERWVRFSNGPGRSQWDWSGLLVEFSTDSLMSHRCLARLLRCPRFPSSYLPELPQLRFPVSASPGVGEPVPERRAGTKSRRRVRLAQRRRGTLSFCAGFNGSTKQAAGVWISP